MSTPRYSYSKLSTVRQCELQYCMRYGDKRYPKIMSIEQHVGIVVHAVIEAELKGELSEGPTAHWEMCTDRFDSGYSPSRIYDPRDRGVDHWRKHALNCVSNYKRMGTIEQIAPGWELRGTEKRLGMPLLPALMGSFMGIIDLWLGRGEAHQIWDFKSGKVKSRRDFEADHQLPLYTALICNEHETTDPVMVGRVNLATGTTQSYLVDEARRLEALDWAKTQALRCIELEAEYKVERAAEANKSILCDWCAFRKTSTCPAWDMPDIV